MRKLATAIFLFRALVEMVLVMKVAIAVVALYSLGEEGGELGGEVGRRYRCHIWSKKK